jgi:DNA primase
MSAIAEAKQRLPLSRLLSDFGLGALAKKSARCPFHKDTHNSFSVYKNDSGEFRFKCHAGCGEGDEIDFRSCMRNFPSATRNVTASWPV